LVSSQCLSSTKLAFVSILCEPKVYRIIGLRICFDKADSRKLKKLMTAKNNKTFNSNNRKSEAKYDSTSLIKKRKRKPNKLEFEAEL